MITLIDYGSGNIYAIANIYKRLNVPFIITNRPEELKNANKLILPGVGAFDETMTLIDQLDIREVLDELVLEKRIPILGICVGMQIMANRSEEGGMKGFGWVNGIVKKIDKSKLNSKPHLPHMGWNSIATVKTAPLLESIDAKLGFYFLHSYHFCCSRVDDILTTSKYGDEFTSAINRDNVYGVQFHPEKSHQNGIQLFENFARL